MDKIMMYLPNLKGGGAEKCMVTLANELSSRGYKVHLCLNECIGENLHELNDDVVIHDLLSKKVILSLKKLSKKIDEVKPYAIISTLTHANILSICASKMSRHKPKVILREANSPSFDKKVSIKKRIINILAKYVYRYSDKIVTVSGGVKKDLISEYSIDKYVDISVIYNPLDLNGICEMSMVELDVIPFEHYLITVGRLEKQKNHKLLIETLAIVRRSIDINLVVIGEGSLKIELSQFVNELGLGNNVKFLGYKQNPFNYIRHSKGFVLSSNYEGLPGVLIQALCCTNRVISTDCVSGPKEILGDGKYGFLSEVGNSEDLANKIIKSLESDAFKEDSWKHLESNFSIRSSVDQYEKLLLECH